MMNFGSTVRELRVGKRFTQRDLATRLGVDFTYISKIENGKVEHPPSEDLIRRMAAVLGADAEELLALAGQFDHDTLRKAAAETPGMGVLLRRMQAQRLSAEQVAEILKIVEKPDA